MKLFKLISILSFVLASGFAFAAAPGNIAVESVSEGVVFTGADGVQKQLVAGDLIREKTRVTTDKDSSAKLVLGNGTIIALKPNTVLDIAQFEQNNPSAVAGQDFATFTAEPEATAGSLTTVRLVKGTAFFKVAKLLPGSSLTVKTHAGNISVKGTTFYVSVSDQGVSAGCTDGAISVAPTGRAALKVAAGKSVKISANGTPSFLPVSTTQQKEVEEAVVSDVAETSSSGVTPAGTSATTDSVYAWTDSVAGDSANAARPVNSAASAGTDGE